MVVDPTPMRSKAGTGLKWTSFGLRRPEHLMHQEFTPHTTLLPPDGPLLQGARHVFIKTVFHKVHPSVEVVICWKINGAAWLRLISNGTTALIAQKISHREFPSQRFNHVWFFKGNHQISRVSFCWYVVRKPFQEVIFWWGGGKYVCKVPYFLVEIWDTLHDIWPGLWAPGGGRAPLARESTQLYNSFLSIQISGD